LGKKGKTSQKEGKPAGQAKQPPPQDLPLFTDFNGMDFDIMYI